MIRNCVPSVSRYGLEKMPESVNAVKQRNRFRRPGAIWPSGGFISDFASWNNFRALPVFPENVDLLQWNRKQGPTFS
jgi:hypothetical protein